MDRMLFWSFRVDNNIVHEDHYESFAFFKDDAHYPLEYGGDWLESEGTS